jgi:hypothetical protein
MKTITYAVIDLLSDELKGEFNSLPDARQCAVDHRLTVYDIWRDGVFTEGQREGKF